MGLLTGLLVGLLLVICSVGGVALGVYLTLKTGNHFIDHYVKKLTPEEVQKLDNNQRTDVIPEENLWASGMDEHEYKHMMGWDEKDRPNEDPDY